MGGKRLSADELNRLRKRAVQLRIEQKTYKEISELTGLSRPTITDAYRRFVAGGWAAVETKARGRKRGESSARRPTETADVAATIHADAIYLATTDAISALVRPTESGDRQLWSLQGVVRFLEAQRIAVTDRSAGRYMERWGLAVPEGPSRAVLDALLAERGVEAGRRKVLSGGSRPIRGEYDGEPLYGYQLYVRDGRGRLLWSAYSAPPRSSDIEAFLGRLEKALGASAVLVLQSVDLGRYAELRPWLSDERSVRLLTTRHWP